MVQSLVSNISDKFGVNGEEFAKLLQENNALVAGSFVVSYLMDWSFEPNDMDVWVYSSKAYYIHSYLYKNGFKKDISKYYENNFDEENKFDGFDYRLTSLSKYLHNVSEYVKDDKRIQVMELVNANNNDKKYNPVKNVKDVIDKFDINICKVGFDGKNILVSESVMNSIKNRSAKFDYKENILESAYSYIISNNDIKNFVDNEKYDTYVNNLFRKEGKEKAKAMCLDILEFLGYDKVNTLENRQKVLDKKYEERKKKYEGRGFTFVDA